jgi:sarcosine oxidase, subunit beta
VSTADVVVIGGGVIGASIAYHAALHGQRVLLAGHGGTADDPRRDATGNSAAQVRMHHGDLGDARLAAAAFPTFENWGEIIGGDCGFRRTGFALLVDAAHVEPMTSMVKTLTDFGVDNTVLTPDELAAEHAGLVLDGVAAVAYEPRSGYADPVATTRALVRRARLYGAEHRTVPVTAIRYDKDRVSGVELGGETVATRSVVVAAGAWSSGVLAGAPSGELGPLPLRPKRLGWCVVGGPALPPWSNPCMVIDDVAGVYFRPEAADELLFGVPLDGWDVPPDEGGAPLAQEQITAAQTRVDGRLPGVATTARIRAASACDAYTPDGHALIGPVPGVAGLYLATGFSGNGFKLAPEVGRCVAAELTTGAIHPELLPYRPERFNTGQPATPSQRYQYM